jgi:hypothetical protein
MSDGHCSKGDQKKGNYLLAVKENQKGLDEATEELFRRSSTREKNKLPQKSEHTEKKRMSTVERNPDAVGFFI